MRPCALSHVHADTEPRQMLARGFRDTSFWQGCAASWSSDRWKIAPTSKLWTRSVTKTSATFRTNHVKRCSFHTVAPFPVTAVGWKVATSVQPIRVWRVEPLVVLIDGKLRDWHSRPSCLTEAPCSPSSLSILFLFGQEDYSEESSKASSEGIIEEQQGD